MVYLTGCRPRQIKRNKILRVNPHPVLICKTPLHLPLQLWNVTKKKNN